MPDVRNQLAAYAELMDRAAPGLEELTVDGAPPDIHRSRFRAGWIVAAAALGVLVIIAGLAVLNRRPTIAVPVADSSSSLLATLPPITTELLNPQAVTPEMFSEWEHSFAGPGALAVVDGTHHMLAAAYGDGVATVAYATSNDGIVWSQGSAQPVLDLSQAPWAPLEFDSAAPRSLVVDESGNWQLYFDVAWFDRSNNRLRANIGRAVAAGPSGPWRFDDEPVVRPDEAQAWMSNGVASPSVVATDGGWLMVFVGTGEGESVVGMARSGDGATWTVQPEPVLAATGDWERGSIAQVDVITVGEYLAMFYTGDTPSRRGLAVSGDAMEWVPHPQNPILTATDLPRAAVLDSEFIVDGRSVLAFIENGGVRSESEVAVIRINVDLTEVISQLLDG